MLFQEYYNKADQALANKDLDGAMAFHDPEFVQVELNHDETQIDMLRLQISSLLDYARTVHSTTSVSAASTAGANGKALVRTNVSMVLINPDTKAKFYFVDRIVCKDSWTRKPDGWTIHRSQLISELATTNGHKLVDKSRPFDTQDPPKSDDDDGSLIGSPAPTLGPPMDNAGDK